MRNGTSNEFLATKNRIREGAVPKTTGDRSGYDEAEGCEEEEYKGVPDDICDIAIVHLKLGLQAYNITKQRISSSL